MSNELTIESFPLLKSKHVHMKDEKAVLRTINKILRDGANNLQVVSDFDRTITKQHVDGKHIRTSFGIFEESPLLPPTFKKRCTEMLNMYRPIEINELLPMSTRIKAMEEWMNETNRIIKGMEIPPMEIKRLVTFYGSEVRDRTKDLFRKLNELNVPVLVFSAGLGDVVEAILEEKDVFYENVKVISNFLKYSNNVIQGFKNETIIHVFNKKEHAVDGDEYFRFLKKRHNGFLMGDTTGDAEMLDGVENLDAVLKIGFLYEEEEKNLPSFMEKFDIVLVDDQTMNIPMELLNRLD